MKSATTSGLGAGEGARADPANAIRCACCGASVERGESKACASCRQPICPACTRWYGHFMLVCDDCRLARW